MCYARKVNDAATARFIENLESRLAELDTRLAELVAVQEERNKVLSAIDSLERLLSKEGQMKRRVPPQASPAGLGSETSNNSSVWEDVRLVFEKAGSDLSLEEIRLAMCGIGWDMEGRPGREKIRGAMARHADVFGQLGHGRYRLLKRERLV